MEKQGADCMCMVGSGEVRPPETVHRDMCCMGDAYTWALVGTLGVSEPVDAADSRVVCNGDGSAERMRGIRAVAGGDSPGVAVLDVLPDALPHPCLSIFIGADTLREGSYEALRAGPCVCA